MNDYVTVVSSRVVDVGTCTGPNPSHLLLDRRETQQDILHSTQRRGGLYWSLIGTSHHSQVGSVTVDLHVHGRVMLFVLIQCSSSSYMYIIYYRGVTRIIIAKGQRL